VIKLTINAAVAPKTCPHAAPITPYLWRRKSEHRVPTATDIRLRAKSKPTLPKAKFATPPDTAYPDQMTKRKRRTGR
jgi:hypothetical protein